MLFGVLAWAIPRVLTYGKMRTTEDIIINRNDFTVAKYIYMTTEDNTYRWSDFSGKT